MFRPFLSFTMLSGALIVFFATGGTSSAQRIGSIASDHVVLYVPAERESLGRELIASLERCYRFVNGAIGGGLPRKVALNVDWRETNSSSLRDGRITIGMNQPNADVDLKAFLFHSATREIARAGLLMLSQGAQREDTVFLFEGMIEILAHEFDHSSRSLEAAWAFCKFLDEMKMLGLAEQRAWSKFSGGKPCLRNASPGITFLTTFRELQGRERPFALFAALKTKSLTESLSEAFRAPVAEVEDTWLKKVRESPLPDEITTTEDAPELIQSALIPGTVAPGASMELQLFLEDRARNLLPNGVFVKDERTGRVLQVEASSPRSAGFLAAMIPIEADCLPGQYGLRVTAIDEAGNLRHWSRSYSVARRPSPVASVPSDNSRQISLYNRE